MALVKGQKVKQHVRTSILFGTVTAAFAEGAIIEWKNGHSSYVQYKYVNPRHCRDMQHDVELVR